MASQGAMPHGTGALAMDLATRAADAATRVTGRAHRVDADAVLGHLLLPLVTGDDPTSREPRPVAGRGWVHSDVIADDEELLELLAADAGDAEDLAARAQECGLPVTPYRADAAPWRAGPAPQPATRHVEREDVTVVDLTAMWAGPLATAQLAAWGARVTTIEPPFRRDGLRAVPDQFAALDGGKRRVPWDLRVAADRTRFEDAVTSADVVVESFSPRVMSNLGYPPEALLRINPRLTVLSLRAFPGTGPEATWVAFGRGVHAASGLGVVAGVAQPAQVAYPDPLAGLLAFGTVLEALGAGGGTVVEVSLAAAVAPLLVTAGRSLEAVDAATVDRVRAATGGRPGAVIVAA